MTFLKTENLSKNLGTSHHSSGDEKMAAIRPNILKRIFRRSSRSSFTNSKNSSLQTSNSNVANGDGATDLKIPVFTLSPVNSPKGKPLSLMHQITNDSNISADDYFSGKHLDEHSGERDSHELMSDEDVEKGSLDFGSPRKLRMLQNAASVDVSAVLAKTSEDDLVFPKYIKVTRKSNKSPKVLNNLFLAQELQSLRPDSSLGTGYKPKTLNEDHHEAETLNDDPSTTKTPMNPNEILVMEFSCDGKYLAVAGRDRRIIVWQVLSSPLSRLKYKTLERKHTESKKSKSKIFPGAPVFLQKPVRIFEGHTKPVLCLSWSKNNFLLSGSMDHSVRLWNIERAECLDYFPHRDFVTALRFHPNDDRFFISGALDNQLRLWSILDRSVAYTSDLGDNALITAVEFTPSGHHCIVGGFNGSLFAVETQGLQLVRRIELRKRNKPHLGSSARGTTVSGIRIFENPACIDLPGTEIAKWNVLITTNDSTVRLVDLSIRKLVTRFRGSSNGSSSIVASLSEDNRYIVSGSEDHCCYVWNNNSSTKGNTIQSTMKEMLLEGKNQFDEKHRTISKFFTDNRLWNKLPISMFLEDENGKKYVANDNTSYSSFNAHSSRVNVALFAPEKTKTLLKFSDDKIFDLLKCGTLLAGTKGTDFTSENAWGSDHIIVTSDVSGLIRVFRQDPAFDIRKNLIELKKMHKRSRHRGRNRTNSAGQLSESNYAPSDGARVRMRSPSSEAVNRRDKFQHKLRVAFPRSDSCPSIRTDISAHLRSSSDLSRNF